MKLGITKRLISLMVIMAMFTLPLMVNAQTRKKPSDFAWAPVLFH